MDMSLTGYEMMMDMNIILDMLVIVSLTLAMDVGELGAVLGDVGDICICNFEPDVRAPVRLGGSLRPMATRPPRTHRRLE